MAVRIARKYTQASQLPTRRAMSNITQPESLLITFGATQLLLALLMWFTHRDSPADGYGWLAWSFLLGAVANILASSPCSYFQAGCGTLRTANAFAGLGAFTAFLVGAHALAGVLMRRPWRWFWLVLSGSLLLVLLLYKVAPALRPSHLVVAILFSYLALLYCERFNAERVASLLVVAGLLSMQPLIYLLVPVDLQLSLSAVPFTIVGVALLATGLARRQSALKAELLARTKAEQELLQVNDSLEGRVSERTQELQDVVAGLTAFGGMVSHDLKAPLRGLSGIADVLKEALEKNDLDTVRDCVERQTRLVARMTELVADLLRLSQMSIQPLDRRQMSLNQPARDAMSTCLAVYPAMQEDQIVMDVDVEVVADPGLIEQVFVNLISNAIKFSLSQIPPRVEVVARQQNGAVVVCIRDNGVGFESSKAEQLFQPFTRLHATHEGTGLGLTIVRRIVERHGGKVWAKSSVGEGAEFFFSLPACCLPLKTDPIGAAISV